MRATSWFIFAMGLLSEAASTGSGRFHLFKINLSQRVPHMLELAKKTLLPSAEVPGAKESFNASISTGIPLSTMKSLQHEWTTKFDWKKEEASMNRFHHFISSIEGLDIHFIHEVSHDPNAIPIILLHGWPGSFLEMLPVTDLLTLNNGSTTGSNKTAFDVVVPSLPGFGFSSPPPAGWTTSDTARVFNTLMSEVLGYKTFAVHGTDWGAIVAYSLYDRFNTTVQALHLNFLPFLPLGSQMLADANITLSPVEVLQAQRDDDFRVGGQAYFADQTTKPNTIGLALYDNPMGQLAWLGEKFISWSDPRQGTGPSVLTHNEILRHVSLYYLTETFVSAAYIYAQNPGALATMYTKARNNAPFFYSSFNYNSVFWPKALVEKVGNLVYYKFHEFGGHFPGLDNPSALADDLRHMGDYWHHS